MTETDEVLVLSQRTVIVAVSELPARATEGLDLDERGAFAVTREHDRSSSTLVDERLAALLAEFRSPSTVVQAIIRYSRRAGVDAEAALEEAYPALRRCLRHGYLVPEGSELAQPFEPAFVPGQRIAGGTVTRTVRALEDAELHQVALDSGGAAALKVLRRGRSAFGDDALRHEARLLRHLDGRVAPRLLDQGETEQFEWLTMEWCEGRHAGAEAAARRASGRRIELLRLCVAVARAYAELHQLGVVHGDVHPGNVIVAPDGTVRLIDFTLSRRTGDEDDLPKRGGVHTFFDPEHAAAARAGRHRSRPASAPTSTRSPRCSTSCSAGRRTSRSRSRPRSCCARSWRRHPCPSPGAGRSPGRPSRHCWPRAWPRTRQTGCRRRASWPSAWRWSGRPRATGGPGRSSGSSTAC